MRNHRLLCVTFSLVAGLGLALPTAARAEKIKINDDTTLTLAALLQPQAAVVEDAAPDGGAGTDFYVRRVRLIVGGQLTERASFFFETDQTNLGKDGNWETSIFVQDAFVSLELAAGVSVHAGMLLLPFSRHNNQSAASLNGVDYHSSVIRFPAGSNRIWRDVGIETTADLAGGIVHLRGGVFNGVEGQIPPDGDPMPNQSDAPRLAAMARVNLLGVEKGMFYSGIHFSDTPILSVGLGVDWQSDAVIGSEGATDHLGLAADVFAEIPTTTDQEIVAQASLFRYDDGDTAPSTGLGFFAEAGYRIGWFEPIVAVEIFDSDQDASDLLSIQGGAAVFIDRHRTNVKLNVAGSRTGGDDAPTVASGTLQAQIFF
jgi:hypothetical protein